MDKFKDEGTTFREVEPRLSLYLRALWGRDIRLRPAIDSRGPAGARRASTEGDLVRLPRSYSAVAGRGALDLYRAAAVHAAAHVVFSTRRFRPGRLKPLQVALVSLIEDARVEQLAMRSFPGLRRLWEPFHVVQRGGAATSSSLLARLSRALIDEGHEDDDRWVTEARRLFFAQRDCWEDQSISRAIGKVLGDELAKMRLQFDPGTYVIEPAYRDDNMGIWDFGSRGALGRHDGGAHERAGLSGDGESRPREKSAPGDIPAGGANEAEPAVAPQQRHTAWETLSAPIRYGEWDYLIGRERAGWCTLLERFSAEGDARRVDQVLERNRELVERVNRLVRAVRIRRPIRLKRRLDGDRLDLDACINAVVDLRARLAPDPRVYTRLGREQRDLSVLVLLDLSQSTNDPVPGTGATVLELAREATVLLADAMERIGDSFAIHGFSSNGRHEVGYFRFKDFDLPYGELAKARLAGMTGQLSTRIGTALRHAGSCLKDRRAHGKLMLLVTDGEPSDIDVHDWQYLVHDARKAVEENRRHGIYSYCLGLDPRADRYVSRIFGMRNWTVVDHLRRLPEKLPLLYMRLTH